MNRILLCGSYLLPMRVAGPKDSELHGRGPEHIVVSRHRQDVDNMPQSSFCD
jgi:hypothetical protein